MKWHSVLLTLYNIIIFFRKMFLLTQNEYFSFQLTKLIETLEKQLTEKGGEINGYIEKHNIQIQGSNKSAGSAPSESDSKQSAGVLA